jgi:hypothetical protein
MGNMKKANVPRINFFDGQRVTERDLDEEQIHHRSLVSELNIDFHGSGVVLDRPFGERILLDTRAPGANSTDANPSKFKVESGGFDGSAVYLDRQPADSVYGERIEIEAIGLELGGRHAAKVLILGKRFNGVNDSGILTSEILEFKNNKVQITENYYTSISGVIFNNFSGGTGRTESLSYVDSLNTISDIDGGFVFREAGPLKVFARTASAFQTESPNAGLSGFITSDPEITIKDEIIGLLGSENSISDLYFELESGSKVSFAAGSSQSPMYGQKFLSETNNLQRVDLLISVEEDSSADPGLEYEFSGDIVVSIHKLSTETKCSSDHVPDNFIDFDPDPEPVAEKAYSHEDLKDLGYELDGTPQVVSFSFSDMLIADPNLGPSMEVDKYYVILVSRRGDNRTGAIVLEKGYDTVSRKEDNGQELSVAERFGRQQTRYVEYDPKNRVYIDDVTASLWFVVHSDSIEVTSGSAYANDGTPITLPKTDKYVGGTQISKFERNISISDVSEGGINYLTISREDKFSDPKTHPRTGNLVYSKIEDYPSFSIIKDLENIDINNPSIFLGKISDKNIRDANIFSGEIDLPGMIEADEVIIINPDSGLVTANLVGQVITPDTDCECTSRYRIIEATCEEMLTGDLDGDNEITSNDIIELLNVVGNTINSETTERRILGGEFSIIDFIKSDLNADGSVDGTDIELMEDAIDGYVNFSAAETFKVLRLRLENIFESSDYPEVFSDSTSSGDTVSGDNVISFSVTSDLEALAIRIGDKIEIPSDQDDAGEFLIISKAVDTSGVGVTITVSDMDGADVEFVGSSSFDITIISGTEVNVFADNINLMSVPFSKKNYSISSIGAPFEERFVDVCDLRRFVESTFIEEHIETCICQEPKCIDGSLCAPQFKTQKVLANDLFIPNGEIYSEPGVPYHGDFEYSNVTIPLPPGSIEGCSIDLYTNFIKSDGGKCFTASGYPAMKFSDGTYVGCEDSATNTDIAKGRVKFSKAIASLHVDALVDGYAVDGYADEVEATTATELIGEDLTELSYIYFSDWAEAPGNASSSVLAIDKDDGTKSTRGVKFDITTVELSPEKYGRIEYPSSEPDMSGDFILDFRAARSVWESDLFFTGKASFFSTVNIVNGDGTYAELKVGWREAAGAGLGVFFSGEIFNAEGHLIYDFDYFVDYSEKLGEDMLFRVRRINEVVTAYYFDDSSIDVLANPTGQYVRIGENPDLHPGTGDATVEFEIANYDTPTASVNFAVRLHEVILQSDLESDGLLGSSVIIGRDALLSASRVTATFPLNLTSKTNIVSASLKITAYQPISSYDKFNITPYNIMNADNLGALFDYPLESNDSFVSTFVPGEVAVGDVFEVDVTSHVIFWLSQSGHLPGYYKAILIESSADATTSIEIGTDITLEILYEDVTTGVIFKVGVSLDPHTGIATLRTKNVLYDALNSENRTVLNFGIYLKKSGFVNGDVEVNIKDLDRIGLGLCSDIDAFEEDELCFFVVADTRVGSYVDGPWPCNLGAGADV